MVSGIDWIWVLRGALLSQPLQHHPSVSSHLANGKHLLKNIHFSHVAFLAPSSSPLRRTWNAHSHLTYPPVYELGSPSSGRCILCLKSKGLGVWAGRLQGILFSSSSWSRHSSPSGRNRDDGLFCAHLTRIPSDKGLNKLPENSGSQSFIPSRKKFSIGCSNCEQLNNVCLKVSPLCWQKPSSQEDSPAILVSLSWLEIVVTPEYGMSVTSDLIGAVWIWYDEGAGSLWGEQGPAFSLRMGGRSNYSPVSSLVFWGFVF